jgi:hypothetical protein
VVASQWALVVVALLLGGVTAGPTLAPAARAAGDPAGARALAAAYLALNGVPSEACADDGATPPSGRDTCVHVTPEVLAAAEAGLLLVQASVRPDVQPFLALMGEMPDGAWGLWFTAPATMAPSRLPALAMICATGGLEIRAEPSAGAALVGDLAEGRIAALDRFVLSRPGSWRPDGAQARGEGWFRLADQGGWVPGQFLVVAGGDCGAALEL